MQENVLAPDDRAGVAGAGQLDFPDHVLSRAEGERNVFILGRAGAVRAAEAIPGDSALFLSRLTREDAGQPKGNDQSQKEPAFEIDVPHGLHPSRGRRIYRLSLGVVTPQYNPF